MTSRQLRYEGTETADRNERITAIAGSILFMFILIELFITTSLHGLRSEHIFVGILLSGTLVVKMYSTGYRFFKYYTKSSEFVRKGPPNIILRILAPFLLLTTILVFISGYGLAFGHDHRLFGKIHAVSVTLWIPLVAFHIYAYIRKANALIASDWGKHMNRPIPGRNGRLAINIIGLVAGVVVAVALLPLYAKDWGYFRFHPPGPLTVGMLLAIIAVLAAKPLLRLTNKAKQTE